jgi:membrane protease YdiL (CAAX protease family)
MTVRIKFRMDHQDPTRPPEPSVTEEHSGPDTPAEPSWPFAPWGAWKAIGAAVLALMVGVVLSLPFLALDGSPDEDDLTLGATVALQICTAIGFILVPLVIAHSYGGGLGAALRRLGFVSFGFKNAAKWIGIGFVSYFAFAITWSELVGPPEQDDIAGDFGPLPIQILLIVIAAPLSEEICFRGMLFAGLRNRMPMLVAAFGAGAFFGLLHYSTGWSAVPVLIVLGAIFAIVYEKTRSIWPAIIMHLLNNALAMVVLSST